MSRLTLLRWSRRRLDFRFCGQISARIALGAPGLFMSATGQDCLAFQSAAAPASFTRASFTRASFTRTSFTRASFTGANHQGSQSISPSATVELYIPIVLQGPFAGQASPRPIAALWHRTCICEPPPWSCQANRGQSGDTGGLARGQVHRAEPPNRNLGLSRPAGAGPVAANGRRHASLVSPGDDITGWPSDLGCRQSFWWGLPQRGAGKS